MTLSIKDQGLIADMKQRELNVKKRQRAANAITYEAGRHRAVLLSGAGVLGAALVGGAIVAIERPLQPWTDVWRPTALAVVVGAALGILLGQGVLRTPAGRRRLAAYDAKLIRKHSGDLHAGRRWQEFYYRGEDIAAYVPQILYFVDAERRFDSVDAALAFAKRHTPVASEVGARGLDAFTEVATQARSVVVSSTDDSGRPISRIMRFVRSERPGVWYVTSAPDGAVVRDLDRGRIAVMTAPTPAGATICSSQVRVRRLGQTFAAVAELYRAQVPGYADGMTEDELQGELVFELTILSATVDTWLDHEPVVLHPPDASEAMVG